MCGVDRTDVRESAASGRRRAIRRVRLGTMIVVISVIAVVVATAVLTGPVARATGGRLDHRSAQVARTYVIRPGDTLWSIAVGVAPGRDPRPLIAAIQSTNDLRAGHLVPGRPLAIPAVP